MRTPALLIPATLSVLASFLLASCFWNSGEEIIPTDSGATATHATVSGALSGSAAMGALNSKESEKLKQEQARSASAATLDVPSLKTQVAKQNGKTVLVDRTLFLNYLTTKKAVHSASDLLNGLAEIESFAKEQGVEFQDSDIMVLIAGVKVRGNAANSPNPWDLCGNYNAHKSSLPRAPYDRFGKYINVFCAAAAMPNGLVNPSPTVATPSSARVNAVSSGTTVVRTGNTVTATAVTTSTASVRR